MQEWEYLTIDTENSYQASFTVLGESKSDTFEGREISDCLPELGKHGWELICSHNLQASFGHGQRFYFKRPLE